MLVDTYCGVWNVDEEVGFGWLIGYEVIWGGKGRTLRICYVVRSDTTFVYIQVSGKIFSSHSLFSLKLWNVVGEKMSLKNEGWRNRNNPYIIRRYSPPKIRQVPREINILNIFK